MQNCVRRLLLCFVLACLGLSTRTGYAQRGDVPATVPSSAQRTQALAESEARFRELATSAFEAILIHDAGRIVDANAAATTLFGYAYAALVGKAISDLLTPELPILTSTPYRVPSQDAPDLVTTAYEIEGMTATGRRIPLEARRRTAPYQGQLATILALHDLTERQQIEGQRQRLAALEEHGRIGRELHDDLGQVMGYMNVQAQTVRDLLDQAKESQARAVLNQLISAAQQAHEDVRHYILGIRSQTRPEEMSEPPNFAEALQLYLVQVQERHGLSVHLSLPAKVPAILLGPEVETHLLRIIQEALTNVRKHAGVNCAHLIFTLHPEERQVVISDDGSGFIPDDLTGASTQPPRVEAMPHFGLAIMRERTASIGGEVEIRAVPGAGTQVIVRLPRQLTIDETMAVRGLRVLLVDDHPLYLGALPPTQSL